MRRDKRAPLARAIGARDVTERSKFYQYFAQRVTDVGSCWNRACIACIACIATLARPVASRCRCRVDLLPKSIGAQLDRAAIILFLKHSFDIVFVMLFISASDFNIILL